MLPEGTTVRRATLDDLDALRGLWRECRLPDYELERRFTEFQVVVDGQGWILATVGLRVAGTEAQVHSLAIRRADLAEALSKALGERAQQLALQQGAHRIWARDAPSTWSKEGFTTGTSEDRQALPAAFGQPGEPWLVKRLREDPLKLIAAEEQLEAYLEMERLRTDRLVRRGQLLKMVATLFAAILLAGALAALFLTLTRNRTRPQRNPGRDRESPALP